MIRKTMKQARIKQPLPTHPIARHDVNMQMVGHASSGAFPDVDADIESLRFRNLPQQFPSTHHQGKKFDNFIFTEIAQVAHFSIWHRHQVSNSVAITIHYQKGIFPAHEDEMGAICAVAST